VTGRMFVGMGFVGVFMGMACLCGSASEEDKARWAAERARNGEIIASFRAELSAIGAGMGPVGDLERIECEDPIFKAALKPQEEGRDEYRWKRENKTVWAALTTQIGEHGTVEVPANPTLDGFPWSNRSGWSSLAKVDEKTHLLKDTALMVAARPDVVVVVRPLLYRPPTVLSEGGFLKDGSFESGLAFGWLDVWSRGDTPERLCTVGWKAENSDEVGGGLDFGEEDDLGDLVRKDFHNNIAASIERAVRTLNEAWVLD